MLGFTCFIAVDNDSDDSNIVPFNFGFNGGIGFVFLDTCDQYSESGGIIPGRLLLFEHPSRDCRRWSPVTCRHHRCRL